MAGFTEGQYVDDNWAIRNQDGSEDVDKRWVDERGYVRVGDDGYDENWYIDKDGQAHDGGGTPQGEPLTVPTGWSDVLANVDFYDVRIAERNAGLSTTVGTTPRAGAIDDLKAGINALHSAPAEDAMGGDLSWAGGAITPGQALPGEKALNPDFVGENEHMGAFRPNTMRSKQDPTKTNEQWTTAYDDATKMTSVKEAKLGAAGLLYGPDGTTKLHGTFGYVVDPSDGTIYTFNQSEGYVSKGDAWLSLSGLSTPQVTAMIQKALTAGEKVSYVHHSSPLAGQPVAGAGQITVDQGKITNINNESGHYTPQGEYLWQTIEWLKASGMPLDKINVKLVAAGEKPEMILQAWKFEQTGGNQTQARLKEDLMSVVGAPQKMAREIEQEKEALAQRRADEAERQRLIAALVKGSPEESHFKKGGCLRYLPDPDHTYCQGCGEDL